VYTLVEQCWPFIEKTTSYNRNETCRGVARGEGARGPPLEKKYLEGSTGLKK